MGATMTNPASPVHEVLGWWLIPVCLVIGSLSLALTTKLIQFLFRRFRWKVPMIRRGACTSRDDGSVSLRGSGLWSRIVGARWESA